MAPIKNVNQYWLDQDHYLQNETCSLYQFFSSEHLQEKVTNLWNRVEQGKRIQEDVTYR